MNYTTFSQLLAVFPLYIAREPSRQGFTDFGGYGMVVAGAKGGEGMGRAAAAEVRGGWVGMVPASPDHARCPRRALLRPCPPLRALHPSAGA